MKFGVFTVGLPEYTPEEAVKVLSELGYDGIEWRVTRRPSGEAPVKEVPYEQRYWGANKCTVYLEELEEKAPHLKEICDAAGLEIFSLTGYPPTTEESVEIMMRAAASIGVKKIRVFQSKYNGTRDYREMVYELRLMLRKIEMLGRRYGVKALIEMHHETLVSSPSAAAWILQDFDPQYLGVIFDPGNMVMEGYEDYQKGFELLGPYVGHVHVKNHLLVSDGRDEFGSAKWKNRAVPLWEGMADLPKLFRVMKKVGYDDTVSLEDFSNEQPTYEKVRDSLAYLKKIM